MAGGETDDEGVHVHVHTDRDRFLAVAEGSADDVRLPVECRLPVDDPFDAYRRARDEGGSYLETTGG